jgi:tRNA-2-methylthio-N6-dimethylallyladenosine synthase
VEECKQLADKGYKEFTLLGQNVNSYGKDMPEWSTLFHDLLFRIDAIPGVERVRFMTSHPVDITRELMLAVRDLRTLCEFVHFPMQAGSNRILKKMHRIYTIEQYLEKVEMLRSLVPNVALGTDIIVGFPTETEEEFMETYELIKKLEFAVGYFYSYSPRKGTPAMRWKDDIPEEVKEDRLKRLLELQEGISANHRHEMLSKEVEVLVECSSMKDSAMLKGRTRCWKNVLFKGPQTMIGSLQKIKIHSFTNQTLIGDLVACE